MAFGIEGFNRAVEGENVTALGLRVETGRIG
jgi:hypothetical protein